MTEYKEVRSTQTEQGKEHRITTFKATQLVWLFLYVVEGLIGLRFIFKLIGVNAENAFAQFLYGITSIFVAPFATLTGTPAAAGMQLEFSSLIAMVVYLLVAWVIERLIWVIFYRPRGPVEGVTKTTTIDGGGSS